MELAVVPSSPAILYRFVLFCKLYLTVGTMFCTIWQHHKQIKLIFVRKRVITYNKRNTLYEYSAIEFYPHFFLALIVVTNEL